MDKSESEMDKKIDEIEARMHKIRQNQTKLKQKWTKNGDKNDIGCKVLCLKLSAFCVAQTFALFCSPDKPARIWCLAALHQFLQ